MTYPRRALLLDCDGVIVDAETDGHLVAFNQVWAEEGVAWRWDRERYRRALAVFGGRERLAALAQDPEFLAAVGPLTRFGDWPETVGRWHRRKREILVGLVLAGRLGPRPGIRRLVREAAAAGWAVAVVSSGAPSTVNAIIGQVLGDLLPADAVVITGDDVRAKKPSPECYLGAVERLGLRPEDCLAVEDSVHGLASAVAAGIGCLVTTTELTAGGGFQAAAAVVDSLGDPAGPACRVAAGTIEPDDTGCVTLKHLVELMDERAGATRLARR